MTTRRDGAGTQNPDRAGESGTRTNEVRTLEDRPPGPDELNPRERRFPLRVRRSQFNIDSFPRSGALPDEDGVLPEAAAAPAIIVAAPDTFEKMIFHVLIVNRAREASVVVEQTIPAGATGSATVAVTANEVEIQRFFNEGGDGAVSYSIDIQAAGQTAVEDHRITGGQREFARFWEKTTQIIINFTNNDLVNASLLQLSWLSVSLETSKWTNYRDNLIALSSVLGIEP